MTDPALFLEGVTKRFGRHVVLTGLNLTIPRGQTLAFLGRNGAGKTTTIKALLGLHALDEGTIRVLGIDPAAHPLEVRRQVGYLAEDQQMFGWMTVAEILRFLAPFYPTWDARLAHDYLRQFELPAEQRIRLLSKGQSVRLGLILALAHRPELMILDDPSLGLDSIMRREFNRDLVEHLQGTGCTVFYSSHLLDEVEPVADAVAILHEGRILRQGPTEQLREDVKQVLLTRSEWAAAPPPARLLDTRNSGDQVAVTVDGAPGWLAALRATGVPHEVVDLSLDEIFAAFVAGRPVPSSASPALQSA